MARLVIDEAFLSQIELLEMLIKNNFAGMFGGNRQSKTYGSSCEFADYRDYMPGDDITKIDWNAYARFDKLYQKLYLDERQMHTRIYIDASRSMEHGSGKKAEQALRIAATVAYLSVCAMDKVSVYAVRDGYVEDVIVGMVGKDSFIGAIGALNGMGFYGDSALSQSIVPTNVGRGDGMSVIISDFLTDNDYTDAINHLADKRRDVLCIQVLSKEEMNPQIRGKMHLFDSEDGTKYYRKNIDRDIARAYREALNYATGKVRELCASRGADYLLATAEEPVGEIFFEKLVNMGVLK